MSGIDRYRAGIAAALIVLLAGLHIKYLVSVFQGTATEHALLLSGPAFAYAFLALLSVIVVLTVLPSRSSNSEEAE